jgi:hypothetical protein
MKRRRIRMEPNETARLAADWARVNPVLESNQVGVEWDTRYFKVGNGVANWTSLPYFGEEAASDIQAAWPIGSVFLSVASMNPKTMLGFGTWVPFGAGRMLVGVDPGDLDFNAAEKTGGHKTVQPAGTVTPPPVAGFALAAPTHGQGTLAITPNLPPVFSGEPQSTLAPFVCVFLWKRIG